MAEVRRQPHAGRGGELAGAGDPRRPVDSRGAGTLDRHRHDHDRPDPARPRARGRAGAKRHRAAPDRRAGLRGRAPHAGLRLATELPLRGIPTGLAAEIFASTLDVYLTLGDIEPNPGDLSTADGRPATVEAARDRLARMVGADRDGFSADDALAFAQAADRVPDRSPDDARPSGPAGRRSAGPPPRSSPARASSWPGGWHGRVIEPDGPIVSLKEAWGAVASSAGCAYALVTLAAERFRPDRRPRSTIPETGSVLEANPA